VSANLPAPARLETGDLVLAGVILLIAGALALALLGPSGSTSPTGRPPAVTLAAPTPAARAALGGARPIVAAPSRAAQRADPRRFARNGRAHIPARWMGGFYPLYDLAGRTFGVNWMLIASIHRQETAFSTDPTTYHGLNYAHCCGGPMQFNVTNGPVSTWSRVADSYRYAIRPAVYPHVSASHPSLYDDFDSIMAAARLLATDGAKVALDAGAWAAAYDYYGHDATGVAYADQVLARAITWTQRGFCINCGVDDRMVAAVHAAYGARYQAR
jgi:hypothetical protein